MTDHTRELIPMWRYPFPVKGTIQEIAAKLDMSFSTVQSQLSGRVKPSLTLVMMLSRVYDIPLDSLVMLGVPANRAVVTPTDRGRAANGHEINHKPLWSPGYVSALYPGMKVDSHTDKRFTTNYGDDSPNRPDYAGLGVPVPGTLDHTWWSYRMNRAMGRHVQAGFERATAELTGLHHDDSVSVEHDAWLKLYTKRAEAVTDALEANREPDVWEPADMRAAFAKAVRKLRKK